MAGRAAGTVPARRHVPTDALELVQRDGRLLLRQGDAEIDVTGVLVMENHPMGRLVLAVRRTADRRPKARETPPAPAGGD